MSVAKYNQAITKPYNHFKKMTMFNSIRPVKYLLYLILLNLTACTEITSKYIFINERPPTVSQVSASSTIDHSQPSSNENSSIEKQAIVVQHETVWDRLVSLYAIAEIDNERIEYEVQQYLKHPEYLAKIQQRAEPYLHFILNEIESKQIPGELALLPAIESAFMANAISKSQASGLWQFMPATGRLFGLKQNWWYDGRNDIYLSTQAAITYLKQLGKLYDKNWLLALAAYNAGKGTIRKALKHNKKNKLATDYWSLTLRKETMRYVPRLLAIAKIFAHAEKYNIPLQHISDKPYFTVINIDSQIDLSLAVEWTQIPIDSFLILNPAYKRGSTDPDGPYHLLIHSDKADIFKEKLASTQKKERLKWIRHKINPGENLGVIALKYHTTVAALKQSNHLANSNIRAGHYLLIPGSLVNIISEKKPNQEFYIVKKGDTFWDIARKFSVRSIDLANWNNLSLTKILHPGQKLIIKKG